MASEPVEIAPDLWRWTARHPDWHPGVFGAEVASFAVRSGRDLLLLDPLLPAGDAAGVLDVLDRLADGRTAHCLITIGYHVRSAEALCERYSCEISGPKQCATRLAVRRRLRIFDPGEPGPAGIRCFSIGKPVRGERPLWIPSQRALVFGDAIVTTPARDLRVWIHDPLDEKRQRWYRERFAPTLEPLLDLSVERVLVTHGEPVLENGRAALREALAADPWYHHG